MPHRFRALDACRGLCAVLVLLFHTDALTHWYGMPVVRNGYVAVDFFFVLSGFVITSAYHATLRSWADAARFAVRRFGRLYPLHAAVLTAYVAVELYRLWALRAADAFSGNTSLPALAEQVFLLQGFTADHETWNYPAWSISIELWVNLAFAVVAVVFRRRFLLCSSILLVCGALLVETGDSWSARFGAEQGAALTDAAQAAFEFLLGVAAYRLFERARSAGWRMPRLAEFGVLPLVVAAFGFADRLPSLALPLIFFCVVLALAFEAGTISTMLRRRPFAALGTYSYSIYLTHSLYLFALETGVRALGSRIGMPASAQYDGDDLLTLGGPWAMDAAALIVVAATIAGSALTYRFIEEPARDTFNGLARRLARSDTAASHIRSRSSTGAQQRQEARRPEALKGTKGAV